METLYRCPGHLLKGEDAFPRLPLSSFLRAGKWHLEVLCDGGAATLPPRATHAEMLSKRETNSILPKSLLLVCFGYLCLFFCYISFACTLTIILAWPIRSKFRKAESSDMGQEEARRNRIRVAPGSGGPVYLTLCPEAEPLPRCSSAVCGWPSTSPKSQLRATISVKVSQIQYFPSLLRTYTFIIVFVTLIFYLYHI